MNISAAETRVPAAESMSVTEDTLSVDLSDGRSISVPLAWFPRLLHASTEERNNWRLIGKGQGIHWEDLDEDISVEGLLAGRPSGESQASFAKWLKSRTTNKEIREIGGRHRIGKINKSELGQEVMSLLAAHERWLKSGGKEGEQAKLGGRDLAGVNLIGIKLSRADLQGAILKEADLSNADLSWTNLEAAILRDADLSSANLEGARLWRANLGGACLVNAKNLSQEQLASATTDERTTLPDGSKGPFRPTAGAGTASR